MGERRSYFYVAGFSLLQWLLSLLIWQSLLTSRKANMETDTSNWHSVLDCDQWVALPVAGQRPSARYKVHSYLFCPRVWKLQIEYLLLVVRFVIYFYYFLLYYFVVLRFFFHCSMLQLSLMKSYTLLVEVVVGDTYQMFR